MRAYDLVDVSENDSVVQPLDDFTNFLSTGGGHALGWGGVGVAQYRVLAV